MMACAHAKWTGEVGVCLATSGPGAIHLLNGLYDAKLDHAPVLAIVGQQSQLAIGGHYQQEVDLLSLFKDVAADYVHMATKAAQVRHLGGFKGLPARGGASVESKAAGPSRRGSARRTGLRGGPPRSLPGRRTRPHP